MTTFTNSMGKTVALGLLLGSFAFGVASCEAGYEQDVEEGVGDEGVGDEGVGDEGVGDEGVGDEGVGDEGVGDEGVGGDD